MTRILRFSDPATATASLPRTATARRVIVFSVAGQIYAIDLEEVREIVPLPLLTRPPGLPSMLAGFLNLAGSAIPVVRLDRLFGLPQQVPGLYTPLLILSNSDYRVALLVEKVHEIAFVAPENIVPVQENHALNDCAEGVTMLHEQMVLLLSAERLLLEKEQHCLAELQALEQKRLDDVQGASP